MIKNPMAQHKNCQHLTMWNSPSKKKKPNGDRLERNLHHSYNQNLKANYTQVHPEMWSVYGCTHFTMPLPRVLYRLCIYTNTLKLGLSRVVHSLTPSMTTHCDLSQVVHDHLLIYLCTIPTLWFKRKKKPYDMTFLLMAYKNLYSH